MKKIIDLAFDRSRVVIISIMLIFIVGTLSYISIPKESNPDVKIPVFQVIIAHDGISAEDGEYLLLRPMEKELKSLNGLKKMNSFASEGVVHITLEFLAGFNADKAKADVRDKIEIAKSQLPQDTKEPKIIEFNPALWPILDITLSSNSLDERQLTKIAKDLRDQVESIPNVLKANISGIRDEVIELIIEPSAIEAYNIQFSDLSNIFYNNQHVISGLISSESGSILLKTPGIIKNIEQITKLPIKIEKNFVLTLSDLTKMKRSFKDPTNFSRVNNKKSIVLSVSKVLGANIIQTAQQVKYVVDQAKKMAPSSVEIDIINDSSIQIKRMLSDLQNNIISAILLVMIIIIGVLGIRPAFLIAISIPGSFLLGILVLYFLGVTINIVVLFALILVVGMIVDGAILSVEMASRKIDEGMSLKEAYAFAAKRMFWPNVSSNATTISVFFPLLFWPGTTGEFMKYLPMTAIIILISSLLMALIFIPVLGGLIRFNKKSENNSNINDSSNMNDIIDISTMKNLKTFTSIYLRWLIRVLHHPKKVLCISITLLIFSYVGYIKFGPGLQFFPKIDAEFLTINITEPSDLSIYEKDLIVKNIENKFIDTNYIKNMNTFVRGTYSSTGLIGKINLELVDWKIKPPQSEIIKDINKKLENIPGVKTEIIVPGSTPGGGAKPVYIEISSQNHEELSFALDKIKKLMNEIGSFVDIEDNNSNLHGIEWRIDVNREVAAKFNTNVYNLNKTIQMITSGLNVAKYEAEDIDIKLRFPKDDRTLDKLLQLRVPTNSGHIPIKNFIELKPYKRSPNIKHVDGKRALVIQANIKDNMILDSEMKKLKNLIKNDMSLNSVSIKFGGEEQSQQETMNFLIKAFFAAIFLMIIVLTIQFNNFYQVGLILSAIIFSTSGVLLGLFITNTPFGIVMCGIGIIALAGIVINNNIVLIDSFNELKNKGLKPTDAILQSCITRMRPIMLTAITTIMGLMPMVCGINIDFINFDITLGGPSMQWWSQLSTTIAGGLTFTTIMTLFLTPAMLMISENRKS